MGHAARKINFMIRNDIAEELEKLVPSGKRSTVVNDALEKELNHLRKRANTDRLMQLRSSSPKVKSKEVEEALKRDRSRS